MHMVHLSGNTSGVSKSSSDWLNYTGFLEDVCVAFFNVSAGNKEAVTPNPLAKEESFRVHKCEGERLSESTKRWIFKSMWNITICAIKSLKYIREFRTLVCYCGDIATPWNMTLNKTNCDWLFDMSVKRPHGRALASECSLIFQTISHQSEGLATRDYMSPSEQLLLKRHQIDSKSEVKKKNTVKYANQTDVKNLTWSWFDVN